MLDPVDCDTKHKDKTRQQRKEKISICIINILICLFEGISLRKIIFYVLFYDVVNKLTRNKNARNSFTHQFLPVTMIGIICLYIHFSTVYLEHANTHTTCAKGFSFTFN